MDVPMPELPSRNSKYIEKQNPKPFYTHEIKEGREVIGYLQLVEYFRKGSIPHLEYKLNEECWNKGVMSKELPKYLKMIARDGYNKMLALVTPDNVASKRLLDKNGFVFVADIGGKQSYIIDLNHTKQDIEFVTNVMAWHAENNRILLERHGK